MKPGMNHSAGLRGFLYFALGLVVLWGLWLYRSHECAQRDCGAYRVGKLAAQFECVCVEPTP